MSASPTAEPLPADPGPTGRASGAPATRAAPAAAPDAAEAHLGLADANAGPAEPDLDGAGPNLADVDLDLADRDLADVDLDLADRDLADADLDLTDPDLADADLDLTDPELADVDLDLSGAELDDAEIDLDDAGAELVGGAAEPDVAASGWRWGRRVDLAVYAGFVLLAVWLLGKVWADPGGVLPADNGSDPQFFEMALIHAVRIFTHGENPLFTAQVNAPLGVNLMANTGLLGLTVPLAPVTALFGAPVAFALLLTLGIAATAGAWYHVLSRHVVHNRAAAILGGAFCGFAPGMVNHLNAHPNLVAQFLIPMILWRALALRHPGPVLRRGVVLGLLVTWQAFINEELLFLYALAAGIFVLVYAALRPRLARSGAVPLLRGLAVAGVTAGVLLAYPLWFQFQGPQHYRGLPDWVLAYGTDLAEYPSFTKLTLVHGDGSLGHIPEQNTFFGWPLLLLLAVLLAWQWRRLEVAALAMVGLVFTVLSLGRVGQWHGTTFWAKAPWAVLSQLPLFDTVVPVRLGLVVIPVVGLLLAVALAEALRRPVPVSHAWVAAFAVTLVTVFPQQLAVSPRGAVPHFVTSGAWRAYVHGDASVLSADTTVWGGALDAMAWANRADQGYRVVGGYFLGPDANGTGQYGPVQPRTGQLLFNVVWNGGVPQVTEEDRQQAVVDLRYWRAAIVLLAPATNHHDDVAATLTQLLGPGTQVDDVLLWDVRGLSGA